MPGLKTLVILSPGFPKDEDDSTCLPAQQMFVRSLNRRFPQLKIIIISFQYPFVTASYRWHGNLVIPLDGRSRRKPKRWLIWLHAWRSLRSLEREYDILGMLSFWCTECSLVGTRFGRKKNIPHFTWILGQDARKNNGFVSWIRPSADSLIAMSAFLMEVFYSNHSIRPAHIIPNGLDTSLFPPRNNPRDIDVLSVGSLITLKQQDVFIRVVKRMQVEIPGVRALLCGKGPEEEQLRKMILDENLQAVISLTGERPHSEILSWMSRSKLLLHPSSYEGFSTVCLEALYAGAHVISFWDPGMGRISHWHIVKDEEEMVSLAVKILKDGQTDYGPVLVYSMDESAEKLMSLFQYRDS